MGLRDKLMKMKAGKLEKNLAAGQKFLEENAQKPGVITHPHGFQYIIHNEGLGDGHPYYSGKVTCHYKGQTIDGVEFDSSYKRKAHATFPLSQVIKGWQIGIPLMKRGAHFTFFFPPELAYGNDQVGSDIGPGSTLIFEVELIDFQ